MISGEQPCAILVRGDTFAVDEHAIAFTFKLGAIESLASMPFVDASVRTDGISAYLALGLTYKAVAVSLDGHAEFPPSDITVSSQEEMNRVMLERCEMKAVMSPCLLFAVGSSPVLDARAPKFEPRIDFARTTVQSDLPGVTQNHYDAFAPSYLSQVGQGAAGAIYLNANGTGSVWNGGGADAQAQAQCTSHLASGDPACFAYASGKSIVFGPDQLVATKQDTHCLAMPRLDCAAHAVIGCAAGMHYTTHTGSVTLESCN